MKRSWMQGLALGATLALGAVQAGAQAAPQTSPQAQAEQRAKAVQQAKAANSPAKRPLTDEDIQKYCTAQTEIVRAKRADIKAGRQPNSAEAKERDKKLIEKSGLTLEEYTFISLRMNSARLYTGMGLCPEAMKADCELYKKHKEQIVAAQKAE